MPTFTTSAGGVIARKKDDQIQVLLLRDRNYPDRTLPKWHIESGETTEDAIRREVHEEAWVTGIQIRELLHETIRQVRDTDEIKRIMYYLITLDDPEQTPVATADNENFEIKRHDLNNLPSLYLAEQQHIFDTHSETFRKHFAKE